MATSPTPVPKPAANMISANVGTESARGTSAQAPRQMAVETRLTTIEEYRSTSRPVNGIETIEPIPTQTSAKANEVGVAPTWSRIPGILESEEAITKPLPINITATASGDPRGEALSVFDMRIFCLSLCQKLSCSSIDRSGTSPGWIIKF